MQARRPSRHLPPGPRQLPIVGNLFDVPSDKAWIKYTEWKKQYGDIMYLNVFGQPMIILNSAEACNVLLEKRSAIYSDRARIPMTNEVVGWDTNFALMRYSPKWRQHRRMFHQYFNETATLDHRHVQEAHTHKLLLRLLQTPDDFLSHLRFSFAEAIMKLTYDIDVKGPEDDYVTTAEVVLSDVLSSSLPGRFMVNLFPLLKYVPSWVPGASFKRQAREWNRLVVEMKDRPFKEAQEKVARGVAGPSVLSSMLSKYKDDPVAPESAVGGVDTVEEAAKAATSIAYAGGADTSVSSVQALFLAMANYPNVQKMAQMELDAVVGQDRLPTFSDMRSLPYISAVIKELLRWHTIVPLSVPHASTEDDEYKGYFIPKGTVVCPNTW